MQKVKVFKQTMNGREMIHNGVVVAENAQFFKVYNSKNPGADVSPATAEWFAKSSAVINCETY